jgi:lysophospholipase L1-like esterase
VEISVADVTAAGAGAGRPGGHHIGATTGAPAPLPALLTPPRRYYLALGDSLAYGFQPDKALEGLPPQAFSTGYVDLFAGMLRQLRPAIDTVNYGCPGESTTPA